MVCEYDLVCLVHWLIGTLVVALQNNIIMEELRKDVLTNKEVETVHRFRSKIREIEDRSICNKIMGRQTNSLEFYKITPKDQLPIYLQKMKFQTLHLKEKDITNSIKIFKKENKKPIEHRLRKKVKESGHLMLLSEIYQNLGESGPILKKQNASGLVSSYLEQPNELDEWEKKQNINKGDGHEPRIGRERDTASVKGLRDGYDYKGEIQRGLEIIDVTHGSQNNLLNRYMLIENSSKLLKKDLEQKKLQVEENIKIRMKLLYEARTEYHTFFQEKNRLYLEEKVFREEPKDDFLKISHKSLNGKEKHQKRNLIEANQSKITRTKKNIEGLEETITHLEQELKKILQAEKLYYKLILKNGTDVRQSGLVWVIQKLELKQPDISHYEFPVYLDKKGRHFLFQKTQSEEEKELLLEEKKKFVNQIGRTSSGDKFKYRSLLNSKEYGGNDRIVETKFRPDDDIPKKYRKSIRKMSALTEEFLQNSSLMELKNSVSRQMQISGSLEGMTHKQIFRQVGQRIKRIDLTKIKREKLGSKGARLMSYQSLLQKIKNAHIKLQDMDLMHQNYLLSHYRDNRNIFFMQAAACFGYKRAYSMIIKHYSWKNYNEEPLNKRPQ